MQMTLKFELILHSLCQYGTESRCIQRCKLNYNNLLGHNLLECWFRLSHSEYRDVCFFPCMIGRLMMRLRVFYLRLLI